MDALANATAAAQPANAHTAREARPPLATQLNTARHHQASETQGTERTESLTPSWLENFFGVPAGRLDASASNNTLAQCFETLIDLGEIRIQVLGDRQHLPDAHLVIANHQSCLDAVGLYLALRRNMDWVVPAASPELTAPKDTQSLKATAGTVLKALCTGDFKTAQTALRQAFIRFPVLLSALPMITVNTDQTTPPSKITEHFLASGSEIINARKAYDKQDASSLTPQPDGLKATESQAQAQEHIHSPRKQQIILFPQNQTAKTPPQAGDYDTKAIALWAQTSTPDAPTKLAPITVQYPNGKLPSIAMRKALSWLTGQRFHNVINLHVDSPMTYEECTRRMAAKNNQHNTEPTQNRAADQLAQTSPPSPAQAHKSRGHRYKKLTTSKTVNDINFPPALISRPSKNLKTSASASTLDPIPENKAAQASNEMASPTAAMADIAGDYQPIADRLAQQTRLNLRYLNNLGPNINPKNTANYAKAFCRLLLMGASAAMVDWVQRNKISPILPTDAFQNDLSRTALALMTLAMVRYTFSGTAAARNT